MSRLMGNPMTRIMKTALCGVCALALLSASKAFAVDPTPVSITPDSLRTLLLRNNVSIMTGLNSVYEAKDQVDEANMGLFPSLNISGITTFNPAGFAISSISSLLSFLVPSNYFNIDQDQHLLRASEDAYRILELNQYASAYALYETIVGDAGLQDVLDQQYQDLNQIYQALLQQSNQIGTVSEQDLDTAKAQADLAQSQVVQMQNQIATDQAAIRQALALPLDADIVFTETHVPEIAALENLSAEALAAQALAAAPEASQITALISAAQDAKLSGVFSFFGGNTLSPTDANFNAPGSLGSLGDHESASIGLGMIDGIALSNDNLNSLLLEQQSLALQINETAEIALAGITSAKQELALAQQAEQSLMEAYQIELQQYNLGTTDLLHLLDARSAVTTASSSRVQSQMSLGGY